MDAKPTKDKSNKNSFPFISKLKNLDSFKLKLTIKEDKIFLFIALVYIIFHLTTTAISLWPFTTDDAYITMRYSKNWADGHGITWNTGDSTPVEGYSNFSYLLLGRLGIELINDPILFIKIVGILSLCIGLIAMYWLLRLSASRIFSIIPVIIFTIYPGGIFWAVSGLETALYFCLTVSIALLFFYSLGFRPVSTETVKAPPRKPINLLSLAICGFLIFISGITRPEGPGVGIALGIALFIDAFNQRKTKGFFRPFLLTSLSFFLPFIICYGSYFLWRFSYFGKLLPNSIYCKTGYLEKPFILIHRFIILGFPLIIGLLLTLRKFFRPKFASLIFFILLNCSLYYQADPIISHFNRHMLVSFATLLVITFWSLSEFSKRHSIYALILSMLIFFSYFILYNPWFVKKHFADTVVGYGHREFVRFEIGKWLNKHSKEGEWYMLGDAGVIPYSTKKLNVYDCYCLNSNEMTGSEINKDGKKYAKFILNKQPAFIIITSKKPNKMIFRSPIYKYLFEDSRMKDNYNYIKMFEADEKFNYFIFEHKNHSSEG